MNIEKKEILNKREYLGPVWPTNVWSADDVPLCSIFTCFQYSLIVQHDLALNAIMNILILLDLYIFQKQTSLINCLFVLMSENQEICNKKQE